MFRRKEVQTSNEGFLADGNHIVPRVEADNLDLVAITASRRELQRLLQSKI